MNGTIAVESTEDVGSVFHIELPKAEAKDTAQALRKAVKNKHEKAKLKLTGKKQRILYIEDNPANLELVH